MHVTICPTITTDNPHVYRTQLERVLPFARRIHVDLADGEFTPNRLMSPEQVWWPADVRVDLHVMYRRPFEHVDALVALAPQLIIVHAEAEGNFLTFAERLHHRGIEAGVALLPQTSPEVLRPAAELIDHVMIFSGNLGYQSGSEVDFSLLEKVKVIKSLNPNIEIGWDGGIHDQNARRLAEGGVEVLDVGGFIQKAPDAAEAYAKLVREVTR